MNITYIICAAGAGTRMKEISSKIPKPLIKIDGKTLIEISCESLPLKGGDQIILVTQKSFQIKKIIGERLSSLYPNIHFMYHEIEELTRGQAETALLAKPFVLYPKIAVFNCDTYFHSADLRLHMDDDSMDGIIPCSEEKGDGWSFCKVIDGTSLPIVTSVEEKRRISHWCSAGFYYFREGELFFELVTKNLGAKNTEMFIAPFYNDLISLGKKIYMSPCDVFKAMGSVQQIKDYFHYDVAEMKNFNAQN